MVLKCKNDYKGIETLEEEQNVIVMVFLSMKTELK